jgi:hypothetical protein
MQLARIGRHTCLRRATLMWQTGATVRHTSPWCISRLHCGTGWNCCALISANNVRSRGSSGLPTYASSQQFSLSNIATGNALLVDMTALRIRSIARECSPQPNSTNVIVRWWPVRQTSAAMTSNHAMFASEVICESTVLAIGHDDPVDLCVAVNGAIVPRHFSCVLSFDLGPATAVRGGRAACCAVEVVTD